ncbi:sugar transferase [Azospirillum sp. B506]|uniref:sugar transferase n=1 Tax=Azospirillum sp. B506 TaxID=137721 RepID=UPI000345DBBC|nr:sugar transferase [Azospirillum sp. B506]
MQLHTSDAGQTALDGDVLPTSYGGIAFHDQARPVRRDGSRHHRLRCGVLLFLADWLAAAVAALAAAMMQLSAGGFSPAPLTAALASIALMSVLPVTGAAAGLYPGFGLSDVEQFRRRCSTVLVATPGILAGAWQLQLPVWPMAGAILLDLLVLQPLLRRHAVGWMRRTGRWGDRVIVVGERRRVAAAIGYFQAQWQLGATAVAQCIDDIHTPQPTAGPDGPGGGQDPQVLPDGIETVAYAVLGPYARQHPDMRLAIYVGDGVHLPNWDQLAAGLPFPEVMLLADLPKLPGFGIQPRNIGGAIGLRCLKAPARSPADWAKRAVDIALAGAGLVVCAPLLLLLILAIKRIDPGPAFFVQRREGRDGRSIAVIKLRTMFRDAEARLTEHLASSPEAMQEWTAHFKLRHDPRILPGIGKFLRRSSLDEVPQLINILKGDMSLVGPRPFPNYHLEVFADEFRSLRCSVPPGLTGLWQVSDRSNASVSEQEQLDRYYINNRSFWYDAYLIVRTFRTVITMKGAY